MNFWSRRLRISFASLDSSAFDSVAMNVDDADSVSVLLGDEMSFAFSGKSMCSSLPRSSILNVPTSTFPLLVDAGSAFVLVDSLLSVAAAATTAGAGGSTTGRFVTIDWYWLNMSVDALSIVCTFFKSFSLSMMCRLWLPSIARNSSSLSCSRLAGIGGGGIAPTYVGGAMKGIAGKKKGGGMPAAAAKEGTWPAIDADEVDADASPLTAACWFTNPPWLNRLKNWFCCSAAPAAFASTFARRFPWTLFAGCWGCCGWADVIGVRRMLRRQVGHVCWRWNQDLQVGRIKCLIWGFKLNHAANNYSPQTQCVKDVTARQLLRAVDHVFAANYANVVGHCEFLWRGVWI